jgi:uncharacterized phage protein (TIGR02218 family)
MRTAGAGFITMISEETTTIAMLWKITSARGTVKTFTDHSEDITHSSETYVSYNGFSPSEYTNKSDFSVDSLDVLGVLEENGISEEDIAGGVWDSADVVVKLIDYTGDLDTDFMVVSSGKIGEISTQKLSFTSELRGKAERLQRKNGELFSPTCRAVLGDTRCKFTLEDGTGQPIGMLLSLTKNSVGNNFYKGSVAVTGVTSRQIFTASSLNQASGWFSGGKVKFVSGNNADISMEVKSFSQGTLTLSLPLPFSIQTGDIFQISTGCDKRFTTCKEKFNNALNFRGEPHIPGVDKLLETAGNRTTNE